MDERLMTERFEGWKAIFTVGKIVGWEMREDGIKKRSKREETE